MIGDNIRRIRMKRNITQTELAEMVHVKPQTVSSWEVNRTEPNMGAMELLAKALKCRKSDLVEENSKVPLVDNLSADETRLIIAFREMSAPEKNMLLRSAGIDVKKDVSASMTEAG